MQALFQKEIQYTTNKNNNQILISQAKLNNNFANHINNEIYQANNTAHNSVKIGYIIKEKINKDVSNYYQIVKILGTGANGNVYLANKVNTNKRKFVAIKILEKKNKKEIMLHKLVMASRNIIDIEFIIETNHNYILGIEYCEEGDLYDGILEKNITMINSTNFELRNKLIKKYFIQILKCVKYCHDRGMYHRDLKPENILLTKDYQIKLCDFGLSTTNVFSLEFGCGSSFYMSPEVVVNKGNIKNTNKQYSTLKCDVWSLGIILINLCFGRNPWKKASLDDPSYIEYLINPHLLKSMFSFSQQGYDLIRKMLNVDPLKRITVSKAIELVMQMDSFIVDENNRTNSGTMNESSIIPTIDELKNFQKLYKRN